MEDMELFGMIPLRNNATTCASQFAGIGDDGALALLEYPRVGMEREGAPLGPECVPALDIVLDRREATYSCNRAPGSRGGPQRISRS
jgi:hypothetical protein